MQWSSKPIKKQINMDQFRRNYNEDIHGQWRANAGEKVVYTEDFPAALLTGTEFSDNSIAKGKATRVQWTFDIIDAHTGIFTLSDNGVGIEKVADLSRFLKFGSTTSSDAYHQYAWGRFRAMTAFMPDYESAEWTATFKLCKNPNNLSQVSHPWSTPENMQRSIIDIPFDETNRNVGFEMKMKFNMSIFGADLAKVYFANPQKLFDKTKERLTTKYDAAVFQQTEFVLTVKKGIQTPITQSSRTHQWKTFEQMLKELIPRDKCSIVFDKTFRWKSITAQITEYNLKRDDDALAKAFPTFGTRCIPTQRVFIGNDGRLIESRHKSKMDGRDPHNQQNGEIVFLKTSSSNGGSFADQPTPSTTKVSIKDECANLPGIYKMYQDEKKRIEEVKAAEKKIRDKEAREKRKEEKAAREKAEMEAAEKAAKEIAAKKLARLSSGKQMQPSKNVQPEPVATPTPASAPAPAPAPAPIASTAPAPASAPTSPSMPKLEDIATPQNYIMPTFASVAPALPAQPDLPAHPPAQIREITPEALALCLKYITSPENVERYKADVKETYGVDL